ncbi:CATRA system-associated protein [Planomonospora venezuelensis]|uniref:CATRA-Associated Small Protein domain-containing protein n=1 Tax=Planomonospora venezuelensis TaxID=1999 RepID=A0A841D7G9_PLAVE|nr:CATRA system-associated protein [Planomonospora venezuelensis]MBB5964105.1 hypothetical protein [Planomonospora venezuelensis]GIM99729.1 hypothetical protein Pve01_13880 [Planomonospora venezuelensis]
MLTYQESLHETAELLGRVRGWSLSAREWEQVSAEITALEQAVEAGDTAAVLGCLSQIESADGRRGGPRPITSGDAPEDPVEIPEMINRTIRRIGAFVTHALREEEAAVDEDS